MQEHTQLSMDIDQYRAAKEEIKNNLTGIVKSFVRAGWLLWRIRASEAFKQDGYATIAEFAKVEYGMSPSYVSRFIEVYKKYSADGDTPELKAEYREYNFSQLIEMLQIPDESRAMFFPEAKRESIREFIKYTKENEDMLLNCIKKPEIEEERAIINFFRCNKERMDAFFGSRAFAERNIKELADILNPSGNMHFKYKTVFMMFYSYERGIMIKHFGRFPKPMRWEDFINRVRELFVNDVEGTVTWDRCFGVKVSLLGEDEEQKTHSIKLAARFYDDVISGRKKFELRKNDRGYRVGDLLKLFEFSEGLYTGRVIHAIITYMLEGYIGLQDGYCILGIKVTDFT